MRKLFIVSLAVLLVSCGGDKQPSVVSLQSSHGNGTQQAANEPAPQSLDAALAELDALQTPEGVDAALFEELKDALRGALVDNPPGRRGSLARPTPGGKFVSQPPGNASKPFDLTLISTGVGNEYVLRWHEVNIGDCNKNGTVDIGDITPIAIHFGGYVTDRNSDVALADCNGDLKVDIADVTGIAINFGTDLAGYNVYAEGVPGPLENQENPEALLSVMRSESSGSERKEYSYDLTLSALIALTVVAADSSGMEGEGVESDPAVLSSGEAPMPPQNLTATSGEEIGVGKIMLAWDANSELDLLEYKVYRSAGGEDFELIAYVSAGTEPSYADSAWGRRLEPNVLYTYYIVAVNTVGTVSEPSAEVGDAPFYPPPPSAPPWIEAEGTDEGIDVTWGAVASDYLAGYEVWRTGPGEAAFSQLQTVGSGVTDIVDGGEGLEQGESYAYKVRAFDSYERYSNFSSVASAAYNPAGELAIVSVNTDRITMQVNSSERAHLSVEITDPTADITWEATAGSFEGANTGETVTYKPPTSGGAQKATVTVTAERGSDTAVDTIQLIITTLPDLGAAPDFSLPSDKQPGVPYRPFSYYLHDRKVILLDFGGTG